MSVPAQSRKTVVQEVAPRAITNYKIRGNLHCGTSWTRFKQALST